MDEQKQEVQGEIQAYLKSEEFKQELIKSVFGTGAAVNKELIDKMSVALLAYMAAFDTNESADEAIKGIKAAAGPKIAQNALASHNQRNYGSSSEDAKKEADSAVDSSSVPESGPKAKQGQEAGRKQAAGVEDMAAGAEGSEEDDSAPGPGENEEEVDPRNEEDAKRDLWRKKMQSNKNKNKPQKEQAKEMAEEKEHPDKPSAPKKKAKSAEEPSEPQGSEPVQPQKMKLKAPERKAKAATPVAAEPQEEAPAKEIEPTSAGEKKAKASLAGKATKKAGKKIIKSGIKNKAGDIGKKAATKTAESAVADFAAKQFKKSRIIGVIVIVLGIIILLYPGAAVLAGFYLVINPQWLADMIIRIFAEIFLPQIMSIPIVSEQIYQKVKKTKPGEIVVSRVELIVRILGALVALLGLVYLGIVVIMMLPFAD